MLDLPDIRTTRHDNHRAFADQAAAARAGEQAFQLIDDAADTPGDVLGLDEVIPLVWKIERGFEARDHVEELCVELRDTAGQRSLELVECDARLKRRCSRDQIGDSFRLDQVALAVEKCAQRELAWRRESGACCDRARNDRVQHDRAAVSADFDDVLAGVRMRRWKVRNDDFIDHARRHERADAGMGCVPRTQRPLLEDGACNLD